MTDPPTYTVDEVAERLGISRYRVYRRIHRGDIPTIRPIPGNAMYLIPVEEFEKYVADGPDITAPRTANGGPMMSTSEVAMATGFSVETVRRMCYDGRLPYLKGKGSNGHLRIPREAVRRVLEEAD